MGLTTEDYKVLQSERKRLVECNMWAHSPCIPNRTNIDAQIKEKASGYFSTSLTVSDRV